MTFQIKDFRSIVASMINVAKANQTKVTDFSVGAVARTLMESPAVEIEELYLQMLLGLMDAIPVAVYQAFDFQVIDARSSGGALTLHFPAPLSGSRSFPRGLIFTAREGSLSFSTVADVTAAAGATSVVLTVVCATTGESGNIAPNAINGIGDMAPLPEGTTFSHLAFTNGRNAESESERKARFVQFISSISRATVDSVRYGAGVATVLDGSGRVQEYVTRVGLSEAPGYVSVYIYGSLGAPSRSLIANAQTLIDGHVDALTGKKVEGYRAAGVSVTVLPMTSRPVPVTLSVATRQQSQQTTTLSGSIAAAVGSLIAATGPGDLLRSDAIVGVVLPIPGVLACYLGSNSNIQCGQFEVLAPGVITVNWLPNA